MQVASRSFRCKCAYMGYSSQAAASRRLAKARRGGIGSEVGERQAELGGRAVLLVLGVVALATGVGKIRFVGQPHRRDGQLQVRRDKVGGLEVNEQLLVGIQVVIRIVDTGVFGQVLGFVVGRQAHVEAVVFP